MDIMTLRRPQLRALRLVVSITTFVPVLEIEKAIFRQIDDSRRVLKNGH
jgi:hypothetical protein